MAVAGEDRKTKFRKQLGETLGGWDIVLHPPNLCTMYETNYEVSSYKYDCQWIKKAYSDICNAQLFYQHDIQFQTL